MENLIACYKERKKMAEIFGKESVWYAQLVELLKEIALTVKIKMKSRLSYSDYAFNVKEGIMYREMVIINISETNCFMKFEGIDMSGNIKNIKAKKSTSITYK